MILLFKDVKVGERFEFRGRRYEKVALSMAHDEERMGNVFQDVAEVVPLGEMENARELRAESSEKLRAEIANWKFQISKGGGVRELRGES